MHTLYSKALLYQLVIIDKIIINIDIVKQRVAIPSKKKHMTGFSPFLRIYFFAFEPIFKPNLSPI